jgi:hypothetical protein
MKLTIQVLRNAENTNTLFHKPIVTPNGGIPQSGGCSTYELLSYLRNDGVSDNEINRAGTEIVEKGRTVLESAKTVYADLERVLEPDEDLGKVLLREARQRSRLGA